MYYTVINCMLFNQVTLLTALAPKESMPANAADSCLH